MNEKQLNEYIKIKKDRDDLLKALEWIDNDILNTSISITHNKFDSVYIEEQTKTIRQRIRNVIYDEMNVLDEALKSILNS